MNVTVYTGSPADRAIVEPIALAFTKRREITRTRWAFGGSGRAHPWIESFEIGNAIGQPATDVGRIIAASGAAVEAVLHPDATDAVVVAGDRWDVLAFALKAHLRRVPIAHIAAGDRAGCGVFVDESFRDAISTMSRWLFASTEVHAARLRVMGLPGSVMRSGLPSTDAMRLYRARHPLPPVTNTVVILLHPEPWGENAARLAESIREACIRGKFDRVWLRPNNDPGGDALADALTAAGETLFTHLPPDDYARLLLSARAVIGNSSSVVIDCAALGRQSILVGERNRMRQCGGGTMWEDAADVDRLAAVLRSLAPICEPSDLWGDGTATEKITSRIIADVESGQRYVAGLHGLLAR